MNKELEVGASQENARKAAEEMFEAIPKSRRLEYLGCLNEVLVYINRHGQ